MPLAMRLGQQVTSKVVSTPFAQFRLVLATEITLLQTHEDVPYAPHCSNQSTFRIFVNPFAGPTLQDSKLSISTNHSHPPLIFIFPFWFHYRPTISFLYTFRYFRRDHKKVAKRAPGSHSLNLAKADPGKDRRSWQWQGMRRSESRLASALWKRRWSGCVRICFFCFVVVLLE